jgi:predicted GIY-YIG superfamily endonuclease
VTQSAVVCEGGSLKSKIMYYVYSLRCKNGYYIGCCQNLQARISRHKNGQVPATQDRLPVELKFYFAIEDKIRLLNLKNILKLARGERL